MVLVTIIWPLVFYFITFSLYLTIVTVVILILKHATTLQLLSTLEEALTQAELDYQKANIDLQIQEHLQAFSPKDMVENFAEFIMATNIGLLMHLSIRTISHLSLQPRLLRRENNQWKPFQWPISV